MKREYFIVVAPVLAFSASVLPAAGSTYPKKKRPLSSATRSLPRATWENTPPLRTVAER